MKVGVVSRSFSSQKTSAEIAAEMAAKGFSQTEICFTSKGAEFWSYNGRKDLSGLTDALAEEVISDYRRAGVEPVSIGVFSNLMEPDAVELEENFRLFDRYLQIAAGNGIPCIATETGFVPGKRGIRADSYESDYQYFLTNMRRLCGMAEERGVRIAYEACVLDVVPSAKRVRDFLGEVASPSLGLLLDPANLIANSSEEDMFRYLSDDVIYFHGKDRKVNDTYGRLVGDGDIDWVKFLKLYHESCEGKPFILEYVNDGNCAEIRDRVIGYDRKATADA